MEWDARLPLRGQSVRLHVSAASDVGMVRSLNEDSFLSSPPVFVVADGMGGHAHGDLASAAVVRVFSERHAGQSVTSPEEVIASLQAANLAVRAISVDASDEASMAGTTTTGIALVDGVNGTHSWMAFNVGDSRIYRWHSDTLEQISVDHSAVQELVDQGQITRSEADVHPERNVVTRALGVDDEVEPDIWLLPVGGQQRFLLCSDGLTKELSEAAITAVLSDGAVDGTSLATRLVAAALESGGNDNVTVIVVDADWEIVQEGVTPRETPVMPAFLQDTVPRT